MANYTLFQWGHRTDAVWEGNLLDSFPSVGPHSWFGENVPYALGVGLDFSAAFNTESERGLPLEPIIFNQLDLVFYLGETFSTESFTISFVPELAPANYSQGGFPPDIDGPLDFSPTKRNEKVVHTSTDLSVVSGVAQTFNLLPGPGTTRTPNQNELASIMASSNWNKLLFLTIEWTINGFSSMQWDPDSGANPYVVSVESPFHTGQTTGQLRRTRIRPCPRSGLPGFADEFVADGYSEGGLMVLPDSWDPREPDPPDPAPDEGAINDEVS